MLIINIIMSPSIRHHKRSKQSMVDTVCQGMPGLSAELTAAEPLPPARALLDEPLQPLAFSLPDDASGKAVTRRGPLAPPLFHILAAASSSSAAPTIASTSAAPSITSPGGGEWGQSHQSDQSGHCDWPEEDVCPLPLQGQQVDGKQLHLTTYACKVSVSLCPFVSLYCWCADH